MPTYAHIQPDKPLMLVVDTSVFIHKIHQSNPFETKDPHFKGYIKASLIRLMSCNWLGYSLREKVDTIIFCQDSKPYWRSEWLIDIKNTIDLPRKTKADLKRVTRAKEILAIGASTDELVDELSELTGKLNVKYKAGRSLPDYRFTKTRKLVYQYLEELGANVIGSTGYEADDMAASLVATNTANGNPWDIILFTVDTDWAGLVNPSVTWICMSGFSPQVRDTIEVWNQWAEKRLKATLNTWRDIWTIKGEQGDKSDNLPKSNGLLLPVIDLLEPPLEKRYWLQNQTMLTALFQKTSKPSLDEGKQASRYIYDLGLTPIPNVLANETIEPLHFTSIEDLADLKTLLTEMIPC